MPSPHRLSQTKNEAMAKPQQKEGTSSASTPPKGGTTAGWAKVPRKYPAGGDFESVQRPFVDCINRNLEEHMQKLLLLAIFSAASLVGCGGGGGTTASTAGTLAVGLNSPFYTATDGVNLYVTECGGIMNGVVSINLLTGSQNIVAGSASSGALDGNGAAATFGCPAGIAIDGTSLYVVDAGNNKIRKVVIATGVVSSLTGAANVAVTTGAVDGAGTDASFNSPKGISSDGTNLYVTDNGNNKIRKVVISTGLVSSLTGTADTAVASGAQDGAAAVASFNSPSDIANDGVSLYVADLHNNKIRKVDIASGAVSSFTGVTNAATLSGAQDGAAADATFSSPVGINVFGSNLFVSDYDKNKIRKIVISTGAVSSLTGAQSIPVVAGSLNGPVANVSFSHPVGITNDGSYLYVVDKDNNQVRIIQ